MGGNNQLTIPVILDEWWSTPLTIAVVIETSKPSTFFCEDMLIRCKTLKYIGVEIYVMLDCVTSYRSLFVICV